LLFHLTVTLLQSRRVSPERESSSCPTVASKLLLLRDKQLLDHQAWGRSDNSRPSSQLLTITESIYSIRPARRDKDLKGFRSPSIKWKSHSWFNSCPLSSTGYWL